MGSKYRELLNLLESEQRSDLPIGCDSRTIYQSLATLTALSYVEIWDDLGLLEKSMQEDRYNYVLGAVRNLSENWSIDIYEQIEINKNQKIV